MYSEIVHLVIFMLILFVMLAWEALSPRRQPTGVLWQRRINNLLLVGVDFLAVLLLPLVAVGAALAAGENGWGLLNAWQLSEPLRFFLALLLLDMLIYVQHVLMHRIPLLWRLHRVHHTDCEIDVTTGVRFHPFEIVFSMGLKIGGVILIGAPVLAVVTYEILLNAVSMFNHSNINLPLAVDSVVRRIIVTPDMHRVHHSVIRNETDSNYGSVLSVWDRIFRTYIPQPRDGHTGMTIGLHEFRDRRSVGLVWLLLQPFLNADKKEKNPAAHSTSGPSS